MQRRPPAGRRPRSRVRRGRVHGRVEAGEQARFVHSLPLKLVIIDEAIVMFGMEDPVAGSSDLTMVVVEHQSLAKVLKTAFEAIWDTGLTFDQAHDLLVKRAAQTA